MKKIVLFILLLLYISVFATQQNIFELQRLSEKFKTEYEQKRAEAYQKAAQMNWPTTFTNNEGSFAELQVLDEFGMPQYYITHNANAAQTISTDEVYTGGNAGLTLSGSGITVREWDGGGVLLTHQEFAGGRVTQVDGPISTHYHSTHVAGTIMASGVVAAAKGMAFAATLRAFDWTNDTSEMASEAALGALISNHSYGYGRGWNGSPGSTWYGNPSISTLEDYKFGFYDSNSQLHDQIAYNAPDYLIVKSAGNDRNDYGAGSPPPYPPDGNQGTGYDCIGTVGIAKNILTVGAVNDISGGYSQPSDVTMSTFSSWGPADDGRIKPDICANGVSLYSTDDDFNSDYTSLSGTSMSSPSVTGSLALLQEYYISQHASSANMLAATLKGLAIHSADEAGPNNGPDYMFGWGLMNTESAANVIKNNGTTDYILETSLSNGGSYQINVNSDGTTPLVATICWTDPAGTPTSAALDPTNKMLVNDLDLRITKGTSTYYPWKLIASNPSNAATNNSDNDTDNVEKVEVSSPVAEQYTITITHKGTLSPSQNFSLIISGIESGYPVTNIFEDDFETNKGWTLTGEFERNAPGGLGGEHGNADPASAHGGSYVLGVDLTGLGTYSGDYEINLSDRAYAATSPDIDCSNYTNVQMTFWRYLNVEQPLYDHAYIDIYDGSTWQQIWTNSSGIEDAAWSQLNYDISSYADGQATVQIRFCIGSTDVSWQYSGWNIDDFVVSGVSTITIPSVPINVTISIGTSDLTISWDAVSGATSYKVYSSDDPYTGFLEDTSGTFAGENWTTFLINVKKFYYVTAVN